MLIMMMKRFLLVLLSTVNGLGFKRFLLGSLGFGDSDIT